MEFDWDNANTAHIAVHRVTRIETEQVVQNDPFDLDEQDVGGELRFGQIGETYAGRILFVVSTFRGDRIRVVTAYEPAHALKRFYLSLRARHQGESI